VGLWGNFKGVLGKNEFVVFFAGIVSLDLLSFARKASKPDKSSVRLMSLAMGIKLRPFLSKEFSAADS